MQAGRELISTADHSLRTPLTSIIGFTELLLSGEAGHLTPAQAQLLGRIESNGAQLLDYVRSLVDEACERVTHAMAQAPHLSSGHDSNNPTRTPL